MPPSRVHQTCIYALAAFLLDLLGLITDATQAPPMESDGSMRLANREPDVTLINDLGGLTVVQVACEVLFSQSSGNLFGKVCFWPPPYPHLLIRGQYSVLHRQGQLPRLGMFLLLLREREKASTQKKVPKAKLASWRARSVGSPSEPPHAWGSWCWGKKVEAQGGRRIKSQPRADQGLNSPFRYGKSPAPFI